jgi:hypothetical protein
LGFGGGGSRRSGGGGGGCGNSRGAAAAARSEKRPAMIPCVKLCIPGICVILLGLYRSTQGR